MRLVPPVLISNWGTPVTNIVSLKVIVIGMISSRLYVPSAAVEVMVYTIGAPPSIIISLLDPNDPAVPGTGRIKFPNVVDEGG